MRHIVILPRHDTVTKHYELTRAASARSSLRQCQATRHTLPSRTAAQMSIATRSNSKLHGMCENEACNDVLRYRYRHMSAHGMITTCRAARAAAVRAGLRQHRRGRGLCQGSPALQDRPGGGRRKQYRVQPLRERPTGSQHQWRRLGARRKPALLAAAAASHEPHITVRILMIRHSCTGIRRRTRSEACEGHLAVDAAACNNAD